MNKKHNRVLLEIEWLGERKNVDRVLEKVADLLMDLLVNLPGHDIVDLSVSKTYERDR